MDAYTHSKTEGGYDEREIQKNIVVRTDKCPASRFLIWSDEPATANDAENYSVKAQAPLTSVLVHKGKAYVPLKSLADAMGYEISYTLKEELDNFHQYDVKVANSPRYRYGATTDGVYDRSAGNARDERERYRHL